jgi:hypothetical protein
MSKGFNQQQALQYLVKHVSPGIKPGGIVFPSQNNNIVLYSLGAANHVGIGNF